MKKDDEKKFKYKTKILIPDDGVGAFVEFPFDAQKIFGKKELKLMLLSTMFHMMD